MNNLVFSLLLDYYGVMLSDKQREVMELYYNEDLSLAEISLLSHVTRQGVRDTIKRGEAALLEWEEKLGTAARARLVKEGLGKIAALCREHPESENEKKILRLAEDLAGSL